MNRRSVLISAGLTFSGTLAGCFSTDDTDESPPMLDGSDNGSDSKNNESEDLGCPPTGHLGVRFVPETSDGESILDAEAEGFTDVESLATALSKASSEYDKLNQSERSERVSLTNVTGEGVANESTEITDKIGYGEETYVEHEDVVYSMTYNEAVC